ncbi:MAG TPA: TOBE domain-containing protein [Bacteroidales bacterium]|nr:TOBE domain-containing protein [Bacteroidales bacterium]
MNKLKGTIKNILSSGNISLVDVDSEGINFTAIIIGTKDNTLYLREGKEILVLFKESEVSIGKDFSGEISLRNQIEGVISAIKQGEVFSKITLTFGNRQINSLITTRSVTKLGLKEKDMVTAFIKANEVLLMDPENE